MKSAVKTPKVGKMLTSIQTQIFLTDWFERENWSGRQDLNLRPLDPQSSALPDCATPRRGRIINLSRPLRKSKIITRPEKAQIRGKAG